MRESIKGSRTEKNLMIAFASEAMAVSRYRYFADAAGREGHEKISGIFLGVASDEESHARIFYGFFEGGNVEVSAAFPAVAVADTGSNLEAAIRGEHATGTIRYVDYERTAREEGFTEIADIFKGIAISEKTHEKRFEEVLGDLKNRET